MDLSFNDITYNDAVFSKFKDAIKSVQIIQLNLAGNNIGIGGLQVTVAIG